jgi:hypothetical protein
VGIPKLLELQQVYANAFLEVSWAYPNVLYSIGNESCAPIEWARYWARYIKAYCAERGVARLTGDMPNADLTATPVTAYLGDDTFDFVDASQVTSWNPGGPGRLGVANIAMSTSALMKNWYRDQRFFGVKPIAMAKIYVRDRVALWSKVVNGAASARYHRPSLRLANKPDAHAFKEIAHLTRFFADLPWVEMAPHVRIAHGSLRGEFHVSGLDGATPRVLVLYLVDPKNGTNEGGAISYTLDEAAVYEVVFYNTAQGRTFGRQTVTLPPGERILDITVPHFDRDLVILVREVPC